MNWKQFLKPKIWTIVIFVVMLLIEYQLENQFSDSLVGIVNPFYYSHLQFIHSVCLGQRGTCEINPSEDLQALLISIAFLILWYLVSCTIVWFYNKYKGKDDERRK